MPPRFLPTSPFRVDVEQAVAAYFADGRPTRDLPAMYFKTAVILTVVTSLYVTLVFFARAPWLTFPLAVLLGLSLATVGFCIQHDANHGAYSKRRWVNRLFAMSIDVLGGSSYFWCFKHNRAHHTYPNITGSDDDLEVGFVGRLSPGDRWLPPHRLQHVYLWLLYTMLCFRWHLIDDFHSMIDPGIGTTRVPRPRGWDLVRFWIGKAIFLTIAFVIPALMVGVWVLLFYAVTMMAMGLALAVVFQLAHCVEEADFPSPDNDRIQVDWATHQLDTTVNFAPRSRFVTWYTGALNYQIEHHLFPRICHLHYPAIASIVEQVARRHGVRYRSNPGFFAALRSHYRWLRRMAEKPGIVTRPPDRFATVADVEGT